MTCREITSPPSKENSAQNRQQNEVSSYPNCTLSYNDGLVSLSIGSLPSSARSISCDVHFVRPQYPFK